MNPSSRVSERLALLTVAEFAERLHIGERTAWRLISQGRIRTIHPTPGRTMVTVKEVAAYLASLERRVA